jgi:hypothetical protein
MKKALAAVTTAAACFAPTLVSAQAAAAKPEPDYTFTGNMTEAGEAFREKRIYGKTFADSLAALTIQEASTSRQVWFLRRQLELEQSGNQYPNGSSIEMDFYGGWKGRSRISASTLAPITTTTRCEIHR